MTRVATLPAVLLLTASTLPNYPVPLLPARLLTEAPRPNALAVADFDGDGREDIVTVTTKLQFEDPHLLKVYPQDTPGTFGADITHELPYRPDVLAAGDVDGDSIVDVVIARFGQVTILHRDAGGQFEEAVEVDVPDLFVFALRLADVEGDGLTDIVVASGTGEDAGVRIYYQDDPAPPLPGQFVRTASFNVRATDVVVTDLDGDTDFDLAYSCGGFGPDSTCTLGVILQGPAGTFAPPAPQGPTGHHISGLHIADLNGDARPDAVAVSSEAFGSLAVLYQAEDGTFGFETLLAPINNPTAVDVGDLDGDGRPDVAVANNGFSTVTVYLRTGTGGFDAPLAYQVPIINGLGADALGSHSMAIADVSSDGKPDIVLADLVEGQVVWFNSAGDVPTGDLSVAVIADPEVREVLANRTFSVEVSNQGPDAMTDVVVYNFLPTLFDFVSGGASCDAVDEVLVTCVFGEVAPGATASAEFVASARRSQGFAPFDNVNDAFVVAREIDFFLDNNLQTTQVTAENLHHAGSITFLEDAYTVLRGAGEIVIPVVRIDGKVDRVTVGMLAQGITAQGAEDFQGTTAGSLIWDHDDDLPKALTFQILPAEPRPDRTFRITLTDLDPLVSVGPIAEATVTIHDPAYVPPTPPTPEPPSGGGGGSMPGAGLMLLAILGAGRQRRRPSMRGR
jgi:uncharacterized repeat protein (TIGR01451 family)